MPEFEFKVELSAAVRIIARSEEQARKTLLDPVIEWGRHAKIERQELIAIDGKPLPVGFE
jgi:hypothetical protein